MYYVYILKNLEDDTLYKGYTSDLDRRLKEHEQKSTRTTARKSGDYKLVWYCMFPTKTQAIKFEKYLKSGSGRAFINKRLID
ncbi:GIY-YIG nuclease family protein [Candidatus Uhrbacteria bacterium]|nr:GIY-YIG nuclease family protein [Candidatus Uhrbacteria bacterium]